MDNQKIENNSLNLIFLKLKQDSKEEELRFLIELVNYFRPKRQHKKPISIQALVDFLNHNPELIYPFRTYLYLIFKERKFKNILSDAGILQNTHFLKEIKKRSIAKILPFQPDKNTLEFILNQVFYSRKDCDWLGEILMEELLSLFDLLQLDSIYDEKSDNSFILEMLQSIRLIMQRMSGRALETDVIKMIPEYENYDSPFEVLEKEFDLIEETLISNENFFLNSANIDCKQINIILNKCEDFVNQAYKNSSKYGISLNVNQSLLRIRQQIKRLKSIFPYLILDADEDRRIKSISFFLKLVKYNCIKNNVRKLINESTQLISYEITQHTAKTGEH